MVLGMDLSGPLYMTLFMQTMEINSRYIKHHHHATLPFQPPEYFCCPQHQLQHPFVVCEPRSLFDGTSIAGFLVKKSDGVISTCIISTGLRVG